MYLPTIPATCYSSEIFCQRICEHAAISGDDQWKVFFCFFFNQKLGAYRSVKHILYGFLGRALGSLLLLLREPWRSPRGLDGHGARLHLPLGCVFSLV